MKKKFLEYQLTEFELLEKRETSEGTEQDVKVKWQHADKVNKNERLYRKGLLQREIEKTNSKMAKGETIWGHAFHPKDGIGRPQDISHKWKSISMEADGVCTGVLTLVPTPIGKTMQTLVRHGKMGISSRGFGATTERRGVVDGKKVRYLEVNDDFEMITPGDFVVAPSVAGAGNIVEEIQNLESQLNKVDDDSRKKIDEEKVKKTKIKIDEKNIMAALKVCYDSEVAEFGLGQTFEEYKKKKLAFVTALWLVENYPARFQDVNKALAYLVGTVAAGKLAKEYAKEDEEVITHYEPTKQLRDEAFLLGIGIDEYVKKLNETVGHGKADIVTDEVHQTGLAGETRLVEKMMEYPDGVKRIVYVSEKVDMHEIVEKVRKIPPPLTEEEELTKEAQRIFRIEKATNPSTTETVDSVLQMLKEEKKRVQEEREALKKNRLAEQIKQSVAAGEAGVLREYKE